MWSWCLPSIDMKNTAENFSRKKTVKTLLTSRLIAYQ